MRKLACAALLVLAAIPLFAADPEGLVAEARRAFDSGRFKEAAAKYLEAADAPGLAPERVADLALQSAWASYIDGDAASARASLRKAFLARPQLEVLPEFYSDEFARLAASVKSQMEPAPKLDIAELKRSARERLAAGLAQDVLYDLRRVSDSTDPEIHRLTAQALEKLGQSQEAEVERRRALDLESGAISQTPIGALPSPPPPPPPVVGPTFDVRPLLEAADAALGHQDLKGAADLARRAADANPRSAEAHRILGDIALAGGDTATAEREYIAATAIDPEDPKPELGLAKLADAAHQPNTAAAHYRRVLEIDPRSLAAALGLGEALDQAGDRPSARLAFGRATEINPGSAAAHDRYGVFLLANGELGPAIDQGIEAVKLDMEVAAYRAHLGQAYLSARMMKEAERELSEAVRLDPAQPAFWDALGTVRMRSNQAEAAVEPFRRARSLAASDEVAAAGLGAALAGAGRIADAREALQRARVDLPASSVIANDLGVVEMRMRNFDGAVAAFERAAQLAPESTEFAASLARARAIRTFEAAAVAASAQ